MPENENPLSARKKILFWGVLLVVVVMVPLLAAIGHYGYKKLNYSFEFGESFGAFDDELGWTLKKNASSYIRGKSFLAGKRFLTLQYIRMLLDFGIKIHRYNLHLEELLL